MPLYEYAIKTASPHGNWTVEAKRYTTAQELNNEVRDRLDAGTDINTFTPLARLRAGGWFELDASKVDTLVEFMGGIESNATRTELMIVRTEDYERLLSAAMAYAYQLHPQYGSTVTWHKEQAGTPKPTQGCSVTDTPPWAEALLEAAKATVNEHIQTARAKGLHIDALQTEHPEHNPHAHNPRPYSATTSSRKVVSNA